MKGKKWFLLMVCLLICFSMVQTNAFAAQDGNLLINEDNFPDENFRNSILELYSLQYITFDDEIGPYISAEKLAKIDNLLVVANNQGNEIVSMQGIEHFYAIKTLTIYGGKFTSLNLNHNTALESVDCSSGTLSSINVSGCLALKSLNCADNQLSSLDISQNSALENLNCSGNNLSSLSTMNNPALTSLDCRDNQIASLDLHNNPALTYLCCQGNQLVSLNISAHALLSELL